MREAWTYSSPLAYAVVRRIEMAKWLFAEKCFHPSASIWARFRALWLVLWGHETEICCICGGAVEVVWWCDMKDLWEKLTGWVKGTGVCCVKCFDKLAEKEGLQLIWMAKSHIRSVS